MSAYFVVSKLLFTSCFVQVMDLHLTFACLGKFNSIHHIGFVFIFNEEKKTKEDYIIRV